MSNLPMGRITDFCSGHKCYPPVIAISGSADSWCDDLPIHRFGDKYIPHCCGKKSKKKCHEPITITGSPSVYTNDRATSHIGSLTHCSKINIMITGSFDTWIEAGTGT